MPLSSPATTKYLNFKNELFTDQLKTKIKTTNFSLSIKLNANVNAVIESFNFR